MNPKLLKVLNHISLSFIIKSAFEMRKGVKEPTVPLNQQYPPGTQEKYNSFQSKIPVMKDGMKPELLKDGEMGRG